nr:multicilin [Misgurnus anguillicaudatus]
MSSRAHCQYRFITMQNCFYAHLPYLMQDDAATAVNQSSTVNLLDFNTEECQSTNTHLLTFTIPDHRDLDTSLELNRQLHATLRRKQEEISALKDANAQLRKLAKQAEHNSTILDVLTTSYQKKSVSHPTHVTTLSPKTHAETTEGHSTGSQHSWISLLTQDEQSDPSYTASTTSTSTDTLTPSSGVKRQLWSSWSDLLCEDAGNVNCRDDPKDTSLDYQSGSKRPRLDDELVQLDLEHLEAQLDQNEWTPQPPGEDSALTSNLEVSPKELITERVNIFGAFRGLQVVTETPFLKSDVGEKKSASFRISIRDHSTVKTKVFPHGKAFTSHTPSGSCRFLWVPNDD